MFSSVTYFPVEPKLTTTDRVDSVQGPPGLQGLAAPRLPRPTRPCRRPNQWLSRIILHFGVRIEG